MEKSNDIPPEMTLETPEQWKAFSHPLRLAILKELQEEARTNEELAKSLNVASGKLYFHTKRLLDAGMIAAAGTRQKGPITEKLYLAAARHFVAATPEKGGDRPPFEALIASGLELYRETWRETGGLPDATELGFHLILPHTLARRSEFVARLRALYEDFQSADPPAEGPDAVVRGIAITVLMHDAEPLAKGRITIEREPLR